MIQSPDGSLQTSDELDLDAAPQPPQKGAGFSLRWFLLADHAWILIALLLVFVLYTGYRTGDFWTIVNWQLLLQPLAEAGLVTVGMMVVIASGGIDLSVGSIIGLASVTAALVARHGHGSLITDVVAVLTGTLAGALNGLLIGWFELPPVLVTLANMVLYGGIALTLTAGSGLTGFPSGVLWWGDATLAGIPAPFLLFMVVTAVVALFMKRGLWGRYVLSVGSNAVAARFSAMPVASTRCGIYAVQGTLCGLAAMLMMARLASARADMGQSLMLTSIAAVVLGGTPITGGSLSVLGTVAGIATFYVVQNGLTLLGVPPFLQTALVASLLLTAVSLGSWLRNSRPEGAQH